MGLYDKIKLEDEIRNLREKVDNLSLENKNLKKQLKYEREIEGDFVIGHGIYISGVDIAPGRYSFKVIYGDGGRLKTSGRDWVIENLGESYGGIVEYRNLSLKDGVKMEISGNVKLLMKKEPPLNINENISIIESQRQEIEELKQDIKRLKKQLESPEISLDEFLPDECTLRCGFYFGSQTIKTGIYNFEVISGSGYIKERGNSYTMGDCQYGRNELIGIKITTRTKLEITDNLVVKAVRKA